MKVAQYAAFLSADALSVYQHTKNEKLRFWDDRQNNQASAGDRSVLENSPSFQEIKDMISNLAQKTLERSFPVRHKRSLPWPIPNQTPMLS